MSAIDRTKVLAVLAHADGQMLDGFDLSHTAEVMYGKQADAVIELLEQARLEIPWDVLDLAPPASAQMIAWHAPATQRAVELALRQRVEAAMKSEFRWHADGTACTPHRALKAVLETGEDAS